MTSGRTPDLTLEEALAKWEPALQRGIHRPLAGDPRVNVLRADLTALHRALSSSGPLGRGLYLGDGRLAVEVLREMLR